MILIAPMVVAMKDEWRLYIVLLLLLLCGDQIYAKIYLVSAGVADYSGYPYPINSLRLTAADAKTMAYLYSKNGDTEYFLLLNDDATRRNIINSIDKMFSKAGENDIVVFFFSGHGFPGGLCAYDGDLEYAQIRRTMAKSKCKNKMMFIDACRSGSLREQPSVSSSNAMIDAKNANVMLLLSSRTDENSIERYDMKNGYFTNYLYKGLRGNADANRDRIITAKELFDFVHLGVSKISGGRQHPVMWGKFNDGMPVMIW